MGHSPEYPEIIKNTIAGHEGVAPRELPDLEEWIGSSMFHRLIETERGQAEPLEFSYLWYRITLYPSGYVTVA